MGGETWARRLVASSRTSRDRSTSGTDRLLTLFLAAHLVALSATIVIPFVALPLLDLEVWRRVYHLSISAFRLGVFSGVIIGLFLTAAAIRGITHG